MKVLVIGGSGYIGSQLVDNLKQNCELEIVVVDSEEYTGHCKRRDDVVYIDTKYQNLESAFFLQFSDIVLLAGQSSVSNSKAMLNVIDNSVRNFAWLLDHVSDDQKLIYASSSSVYGRTYNKEVSEDFNKTSGYEPYNYYDWSKQTIDQLAELSNKHYYSLRFGTVNGFSRNLRNDVMINSMVYNAKKNGKLYITNPHVNRPILGINDLCRAVAAILTQGRKELSGIYNLNSFNASVMEIATNVSKLCEVPCEYLSATETTNIVNFKLQTKCYDFKIFSDKFCKAFNFEFVDTMESITCGLFERWGQIEHFENRLVDKFVPYKRLCKCRACGKTTKSLLDLGSQPLANNYCKTQTSVEEVFPLNLHYCNACFHVQLDCVVRPDKLFKNYLYVSGTSETLKRYFAQFAETSYNTFVSRNGEKSKIKVLDIACNDGSQLDAFSELQTKYNVEFVTVGVDPAENIFNEFSSKKIQHDIRCEFFSQETADSLKQKYGSFDIIIAQNVFAHIDYPGQFLGYVKGIMNDSTLLKIQTSQKDMILRNQFDTAYHEHLSFFNTKSMRLLCDKQGLFLNNVNQHEIHGTSYIFEISTKPFDKANVDEVLAAESKLGLYDEDTYTKYRLRCLKYRNSFMNRVIDYKLAGMQVIAFGSTAKSMTLLNFCGVTSEQVDYMVDENKLKQGLYTPGSKIPVVSMDDLKDIVSPECVILVTAWNFYDEIKAKVIAKLSGTSNPKRIVHLLNIDSLVEDIIAC